MEKNSLCALLIVIAALVQSYGAHSSYSSYDKDLKVVNIAGKVLCQDCTKDWYEYSRPTNPIRGAIVAVTCMDSNHKLASHTSDVTDEEGYFNIPVLKYVHGKMIHIKDCIVRLVKSPDSFCDVMTDFGGGKCGVQPHHPSIMHPGNVEYTVGPFYFTPSECDEPKY